MESLHLLCVFSLLMVSSPASVRSQQPYVGRATTDCGNMDNSTSVLGYFCNGENDTCQAYLTFRSQPPYDSVPSISALIAANTNQLAQLNSVSDSATFNTGQLVLVPVRCSCSGQYYQSNATYVVQTGNTYLTIANNTFQGLSTCQALQVQNSNIGALNLIAGTRIMVPLRCACPTKSQADAGVRYLLSYLVTYAANQFVSGISSVFGVDTGRTLEANGLTEQSSTINPFTTLLVPLENPPTSSQTVSPPSSPLAPPPPTQLINPPSSGSSSKTWLYVLVGVIGGVAFAVVIGFAVFCFCFPKRKRQETEPHVVSSQSFEAIEKPGDKDLEEGKAFLEGLSTITQSSIKVYKFEELQSATDDFSPSCWIKGSIYRGKINGDYAAIKKADRDVSKEIKLLNRINHHNLIRLSGVCFNEGHWYLVYEYATNGPLSDWLYDNKIDSKSLTWIQRMQIALDVATGLNYLHTYTSPPYVHKDLTSSNILLDSEFRAKITKFDLARSANGEEGQFFLTRHIVGTKGYMSPEYLENGLVSTKLDVYAFGILVLEMLTGKRVADLFEGLKGGEISEVLVPVLSEEGAKESLQIFMDPSLQGNYPSELALVVVKLIDKCIKKDPLNRPDLSEVVQNLSRTVSVSLSWEVSASFAG